MIDEFDFIDLIKEKFSSNLIGDDAAVINNFLVSKDILIENVHFIINNNFFEIGAKSLISNISDIIAMGGNPLHFFLGLGIPEKFSLKDVESFLDGLNYIASKYNVTLSGGDTSKSKIFFVSITIIGEVINKPIFRNNAQANDDIWIVGDVGDAFIGLEIILENIDMDVELKEYFITKHYMPELYPEFIINLNQKGLINAMIDISDGFLQDMLHILKQSRKGAKIYSSKIPLSNYYKLLKDKLGEKYFTIPFISGEEYKIIFTSSKKDRELIKAFSEKFSVKVTNIGEIILNKGNIIEFVDSQKTGVKFENFSKFGYKHF